MAGLDMRPDTGPLGQADEILHGPHAELAHHAAAMDLDRLLDRAEITGDLLVEAARHHMGEDLALARGELGDEGLDRRRLAALVAALRVEVAGARHRAEEGLAAHRLGEEVDR